MEWKHVDGENRGKINFFALSTCIWCRKTKALLNRLGVDYYYIDVDLVTGDDVDKVRDEMGRWNPMLSFPTIIIDDDKVITGYREQELKEALGYGDK
jgi:glutaredoxin